MNHNIYQHFRDDEKQFIDSATDWVQRVESQYVPYLTDFLDPREVYILKAIIGSDGEINVRFNGLVENAERVRALIYPSYYEVSDADFNLELLEVSYFEKFNSINHGQILGTLTGEGLKREKIGDIITDGFRWQVIVDKNIASFIILQINHVSRVKVQFKSLALKDMLQPIDEWKDETKVSTSLRVDNVLSTVLNLSREKAKILIQSNRVKLNWTEINQTNIKLEMNDVVSIRGFGRIKIIDILGQTKKDNLVLSIKTLLKK